MSLDRLLNQTRKSHRVEENVPLFLPPEYELTLDKWRELIKFFNLSTRKAKVAEAIIQYIRQNNPKHQDFSNLISISDIVEKDGRFYTDLSFQNEKPGLTAYVIFKSENLQLVPVVDSNGKGIIAHVTMTYIPD